MKRALVADRVSAERFVQAESPRWTGGEEVCFVDMGRSAFHVGRFADGAVEVVRTVVVGGRIGSAARIESSDDWMISRDRELVRVDAEGRVRPRAQLPDGAGFVNDGICDHEGRFWVGTQTADRSPRAGLYLFDGSAVSQRLTGVTVGNGLCFSADGRTLYFIDTLPYRTVDALGVGDRGALSRRHALFAVEGGNPDGMTIDVEGALWVAVWGAGEVRRYAPDGRVLDVVEVPAERVSAVALVESTLLITTARRPDAPPSDLGGHLFAASAPAPGRPASRVRLPLSE